MRGGADASRRESRWVASSPLRTFGRRRDFAGIARSVATTTTISRSDIITADPKNNVTDNIFQKLGVNLHHRKDHPLGIIKGAIFQYFEESAPGKFKLFEDLYPVVTTKQNFDELLIPADHISRSDNDTYYVNSETVLRCHTSAHQAELLREKHDNFLVIGDVYRRDTIDATHYPVFHQMEGVKIFDPSEWEAAGMSEVEYVERDLKQTLEGLAKHLFGDVECRWVDAYFPFTDPSIELEIFFNGEWLEGLGSGIRRQDPSTWNNARWPEVRDGGGSGLLAKGGAVHTKAVWDVRAHPRVVKSFREVLGEEDLIASLDVIGLFRPWGLAPPEENWRTRGGWW